MEAYRIEGSTCLVTGGAGLIGSTIVDKLFERRAKKVHIIDDYSEGHEGNLENVAELLKYRSLQNPTRFVDILLPEGIPRDLTGDRETICDWFDKCRYDYVFHCGGHLLLKAQAEPYEALFTNVIGSFHIFDAAFRSGVKKLVFTSSCSVFGEPINVPVSEDHPLNNTTIYGATKICGEHMLRDFGRRGLKYSVIRPYNVYGPRQSPKNGSYAQVVPKWIKCVLSGNPIIIYGSGEQTADLVHVKDMAQAHILSLEKGTADGECFNVGTGVSTDMNTLAALVCKHLGKPGHPIIHIPQDQNIVKQRRCDIRKARELLGYLPDYDLEKGLQQTCRWWMERE